VKRRGKEREGRKEREGKRGKEREGRKERERGNLGVFYVRSGINRESIGSWHDRVEASSAISHMLQVLSLGWTLPIDASVHALGLSTQTELASSPYEL
jgi:hypothetical protein